MGIKKYKIYPSASISTIDFTKVEEGIRWNFDNTEFIVEFIKEPHGNTVTLSYEETIELISQFPWDWDTGD